MTRGARTPEELDTLLEDAFVLRDESAPETLFDDGAVFVEAGGHEARGGAAIARALAELWADECTYLARTTRVLRTGDTALVVADAGIHVVRRGRDGTWRATISLLELHTSTTPEDQMTQDTHTLNPITTRSGEGEARWWFSNLAEIKATAEQTGGLLAVIEVTEPPNAAGPLHVHHREDESFWILEGGATFEIGNTTIEASAGDFVFAPRDIPHRYTVGDAGCRMLFIMTPGGFENLVRGMSTPAQSRTLPPPSDEEPDWEHIAAVAQANGCELLA
jgi:quercetin dioxygenase-like cupin family protein/ketosteroid isomerase-like protein